MRIAFESIKSCLKDVCQYQNPAAVRVFPEQTGIFAKKHGLVLKENIRSSKGFFGVLVLAAGIPYGDEVFLKAWRGR